MKVVLEQSTKSLLALKGEDLTIPFQTTVSRDNKLLDQKRS